jgi:hypothetical protein
LRSPDQPLWDEPWKISAIGDVGDGLVEQLQRRVAPMAQAVIIARWYVSWWTVSPGMLAALSASAI